VVYAHDGVTPIAVMYSNGKPHAYYIDPSAPESRLMMSLQEQSFTDEAVRYVNGSSDGSLSLFRVYSDRDPGSYYVYDATTRKANLLISNMEWLNTEAMAEVKPFEFKARDGLMISGLLTVPHNHGAGPMPLIVYPHGGPIGIDDAWGFDSETQMLAARGYAVLQVNFRGSGNYGRKFMEAGFRQWGAAIQDDITDATRWAIAHGNVDPKRICIYGSSFGAYAALMGAAREPSLYRCAVGYVGVYNLSSMRSKGDVGRTKAGRSFLVQELGEDPTELASRSPTNLAAQIKIPVFLATAGRDERAPQAHSEQMRDKLTSAGNAPEWLAFPTEGHGYYTPEHQREFYEKLFAFLDRNLGAKTAADPSESGKNP
jgi:dipeptidyl aminopeptidase/acylaminoacyl peptidase